MGGGGEEGGREGDDKRCAYHLLGMGSAALGVQSCMLMDESGVVGGEVPSESGRMPIATG